MSASEPLKYCDMKKILYVFAAAALISCACDNSQELYVPSGGGDKPSPTPAPAVESDWGALADSCTNVLVANFLDKSTGTFWATPGDIERSSEYIYWQQAHALDVLLEAAVRNPLLRDTYLGYADKWYANYAHNYNRSHRGEGTYGGFFNQWTDDMAWICLTLMHISEVSGDAKYRETSKEVFDKYIWPRRLAYDGGFALPWTDRPEDVKNFNACTNAPSCLTAAKLHLLYPDEGYLDIAKTLYKACIDHMPDAERAEEPPLTYTQGTFGEACRALYHITGDQSYMDKAGVVLQYAFTSNRCNDSSGVLRHEGTSMDQSLFKAVLIPYAVNYVTDADADSRIAQVIREKLLLCAKTLDRHLDRTMYPRMYCDYFWGTTFNPSSGSASMGAQASGASLMEGVARMTAE